MTRSRALSTIVSSTIFSLLLSTAAQATIVQSALAPNKIGISVSQLFATTASNNSISFPVASNSSLRPATMGAPNKAIHLGTNTDIFQISSSEYWIRYTLDNSSSVNNINPYASPEPINLTWSVTGEFWLKSTNNTLTAYLDRATDVQNWIFNEIYTGNISSPRQVFSDVLGSPFACAQQPGIREWNSTLNLSFLTVFNGQLFTSDTGYDTLFVEHAYEGETVNRQYNIAPVPVPTAAWLMSSALIGLVGLSRRRIR